MTDLRALARRASTQRPGSPRARSPAAAGRCAAAPASDVHLGGCVRRARHLRDVVFVASNQPTRLDTAGEEPAIADLALTIQRVEARGGENGTSEVTVVFDAPLPIDAVPVTDTVESVDPGSLVAAVQDPGPGAVEVCGTKHWFPVVPSGSGSVDLLIPASWLVGDPPVLPSVTPLEPSPGKVILCGPYQGHVQISIWGAAPMATETLDVRLNSDRTRIIVQVIPSENAQCVASGHPTITVPDVVGRPLAEAIQLIKDDGLAVIGRGVPDGDPSLDTSIVRAQEPPAGEPVPEGHVSAFAPRSPRVDRHAGDSRRSAFSSSRARWPRLTTPGTTSWRP